MKINELARLSGVNPETIRMYRQKGLLHPTRLDNGYFDYSDQNLYELLFVRKLREANLGLEIIASFYKEETHASTMKAMAREMNALDDAIRELEQRKKQLMATLGHYVLFRKRQQPVQELKLRSECWFFPLETRQRDTTQQWLKHQERLFESLYIAPEHLTAPQGRVPYSLWLGIYTEELKRCRLPLSPQARRMPAGIYLISFIEARMDGTIDAAQLHPMAAYAAEHHYTFCPEQGSFLYGLNDTPDGIRMVYCFQARVEPEK